MDSKNTKSDEKSENTKDCIRRVLFPSSFSEEPNQGGDRLQKLFNYSDSTKNPRAKAELIEALKQLKDLQNTDPLHQLDSLKSDQSMDHSHHHPVKDPESGYLMVDIEQVKDAHFHHVPANRSGLRVVARSVRKQVQEGASYVGNSIFSYFTGKDDKKPNNEKKDENATTFQKDKKKSEGSSQSKPQE